MRKLDDIGTRLDRAPPGPWETYFTVHGDPFVLGRCRRDPARPGRYPFDVVASVATGPADYGRAAAELIAASPADLRDLVKALTAVESVTRSPASGCPACEGVRTALTVLEGE